MNKQWSGPGRKDPACWKNDKRGNMMRRSFLFCLLALITFPAFSQVKNAEEISARPSVGLVLSGGGAKGFAYIGLLKVIQEAGLPIDYIGGSSIGSIIGGLYALGYSPDTIARLIRSQNWHNLLRDIIDRKYIAFEEKEFGENAIIRLPVRNKKITMSSAMFKGEEINLLLNYYFSPAYNISDFHKLPTPFLCVGTDLLSGEEVILDSGYLPMAIRASMSIPGYFQPTEYGGHYLVDGGVVNNYPVKAVKKMGAEIIVGGDVQSGLYTSREQLTSIMAILDQITSFHRIPANVTGDNLTDLKIKFSLNYGMMDFEAFDSIIAAGERTARQFYPRLKELADSLNAIEYKPLKEYKATPPEKIYINNIRVTGVKHLHAKYLENLLHGKEHSKISLKELESDIHYLKGTGYFENVSYRLENTPEGADLVIDARETGVGELSAGAHYDDNYSVSLTLNAAFRNVLGDNSKLFANMNIGPNPRLRAVYLRGIGRVSAIGISTDMFTFNYDYYDKDKKLSQINYSDYKGSVYFNHNALNSLNLKAGIDYEYFRYKEDYPVDSLITYSGSFLGYGTAFLSLTADTRDRPCFSTSGFHLLFRGEYVVPLSKKVSEDLYNNAAIVFIKYDQNVPLWHRFTFQPGIFAGSILNPDMKPATHHTFLLGGLSAHNYLEQIIPFSGTHFLQEYGYYALVGRAKLQYNVYQKLYVTLRADGGANVTDFGELFKPRSFLFGYGITASYDSFIGPVEVSFMGSNINPNPMLYLNIGFWF